jgi:esterase/lipase superfamily enzyme
LQPDASGEGVERMYGGDRGELELGTCEVSVPKDHQVGTLESPSVLRLEFRQDPERHVVLLGVHPQPDREFYADLRKCVEQTARKEAFVFIHGYNVGFEKAVRRTAQIAYDLKFKGAPIVYSWPSQEGLLSYTVDETNVAWTVPHLKDFLLGVAQQSGATSVHLIAHSMGNRALTSALRELALEHKAECPRFHEVVLTAPDIDADVFRRDLAPAIVGMADRVTLYASSNDEALMASRAVHGYRRAGDSGNAMVVVTGVDTVDVSEVDTSLIGHSYYGSNTTVLADLFELVQGSKPPDQRKWLRAMRLGALKYWKFLGKQLVAPQPPPGEEL